MNIFAGSIFGRRAVLVPVLGVLVLVIVWWFAWMSPEGSKLSSVREQQTTDQQTEVSLNYELTKLKADAKQVRAAAPFFRVFEAAIPSSPDAQDLIVSLFHLATKDHVTLESVTDNTVSSSAAGYSTIPVSLTVSGPHDDMLSFISGMYGLSRLLTIQTLSLTGDGNLNASSTDVYSASISATAFTTAVATTKPAAS